MYGAKIEPVSSDHSRHYSEVVDGIYIGSYKAATGEIVKALNVGLVVKCESVTPNRVRGPVTVHISGFDDTFYISTQYQRLLDQVEPAVSSMKEFADNNPNKSMLVHCYAGQNRSAFVIGVYLRKHRGMTYQQVIDVLDEANKRRGVPALWNTAFDAILENM